MLKPEDLIGAWRLRSWKNTGSDGSSVYPVGEHPVGYISYHNGNYVSVEIMAANRQPFRDGDVFGGTADERSAAISTYVSYAGTFEVRADERAVVHHIEVCSFPNWVGDAQVRFAELDGDSLTLSTKPMMFQGVERTARLVWDRVSSG